MYVQACIRKTADNYVFACFEKLIKFNIKLLSSITVSDAFYHCSTACYRELVMWNECFHWPAVNT